MALSMSARTLTHFSFCARLPDSTSSANESSFRVADMPHVVRVDDSDLNLERANSISTPLLLPIRSCHSSMTTNFSCFKRPE